ncbi:hypothetical protein [Edaphobacter aggregans]|uniref:hypothetical protein n=1 Tax=Edaphobacter aggregans TaxID=570835 RepID=UPI000F74AC15|nr:hypothetical protein [Edaphobacter aggregans]
MREVYRSVWSAKEAGGQMLRGGDTTRGLLGVTNPLDVCCRIHDRGSVENDAFTDDTSSAGWKGKCFLYKSGRGSDDIEVPSLSVFGHDAATITLRTQTSMAVLKTDEVEMFSYGLKSAQRSF